MITDSRGGHNRKQINKNFFKKWSPNMAYILGLIAADGSIEDVRKSSRTCYLQITNTDKDLLNQVLQVMGSNHSLIPKKSKEMTIHGKKYSTSTVYNLRIGSKEIVQDLINLGLIPRKTKRLTIPKSSKKLFNFFVRGYFDGDGCVHKDKLKKRLAVIFTSGCNQFLKNLSLKLSTDIGIPCQKLYLKPGGFDLVYKGKTAKILLQFMYKNLNSAPFMKRKYFIYHPTLESYSPKIV